MRNFLTFSTLLAISLLTLSGCDFFGDDEVTLSYADVAGTYETTRFSIQIEGQRVDVLEAGGFIRMTLHTDGTVDGRLYVPETVPVLPAFYDPSDCDPEEEDCDMGVSFGGTYAVNGRTVTFEHRVDTFITDFVWTYRAGTLIKTGYRARTLTKTGSADEYVEIKIVLKREQTAE